MRGTSQERSLKDELKLQMLILLSCVALAWALELFDLFVLKDGYNFGGGLDNYGIIPKEEIGLRGILFAPFLHGGLGHLIGNTIPFLVLGWLVMLRETSDFFIVSVLSASVSGSGTWIFGSPGIHLGSSGVIFGYLGYLLARGYFERSAISIFLSLFVGSLYGSLLWGILPVQRGISWEGHLFGLIGGILAAKLLADSKPSGQV